MRRLWRAWGQTIVWDNGEESTLPGCLRADPAGGPIPWEYQVSGSHGHSAVAVFICRGDPEDLVWRDVDRCVNRLNAHPCWSTRGE